MASLNKELWYAVQKDDLHSAKAALDNGANPNHGDRFAGEFFHLILIAVKWSCPDMIKLLLEYGADVHTIDNVGDTALHLAAWGNNKEAIDILLLHGASLRKTNLYGQTPYDVSRIEKHDLENLLDYQEVLQNDEMIQLNCEIIQSNQTQIHDRKENQQSAWQLMYQMNLNADQPCGYTHGPWQLMNDVDLDKNQRPSLESQISVVSQGDGYKYPNNKGRILLFNYTKFNNPKKNRTGAEEDNEILERTFQQFDGKYEVIICDSYTTQETFLIVKKLQQDDSLKEVDSLVIFISSHGESRNVFYTRDGMININDLRSLLFETSNGCLFLKGKPKIIMANYCQGQAVEEPTNTAVEETSDLSRTTERGKREREIKSVARNIKTFFSTSDGVVAWRKSTGGNYFLQTFCKVLSREPGLELQQLIFKTNEEVEAELRCNSTFSEEGSRFNHFYF